MDDEQAIEPILCALNSGLLSCVDAIELCGVVKGIKRIARLVCDADRFSRLLSLSATCHLACRRSGFVLQTKMISDTGDKFVSHVPPLAYGENRDFVVYITKSNKADLARILAEVETSSPGCQMVGELLDYPSCCVNSYAKVAAGAYWPRGLLATMPSTGSALAGCNRFLSLWGSIGVVPDYFPCSLVCSRTQEMFKRYHAVLGCVEFYKEMIRYALKPLIIRKTGQSIAIGPLDDSGGWGLVELQQDVAADIDAANGGRIVQWTL
jgi:hypothetical protein